MLTKGAIGNLVNRYKAVLTKCNLINTFGSLAVASMLVLGGAGVAGALTVEAGDKYEKQSDVYGGAISTSDAIFKVNGTEDKPVKFIGNTANGLQSRNGGGAIYSGSINATIDYGQFTNNYVANSTNKKYGNGQAITQSGGSMTINKSTFEKNGYDADNNSYPYIYGTVAAINSATLNVTNSIFENNFAKDGGALQINGSTATISGSEFKSNTVNNHGGAINLFHGATATMSDKNTFFRNYGNSGGAVMLQHKNGNYASTLNFAEGSTTEFSDNSAMAGGAINNTGTIFSVDSNITFIKNSAKYNAEAPAYLNNGNGGAIVNEASLYGSAVITLDGNVKFENNSADKLGGAIYNSKNATINFNGAVKFTGNTDSTGTNDIYNLGTINVVSGTTTLGGGLAGEGTVTIDKDAVLALDSDSDAPVSVEHTVVFAKGATLNVVDSALIDGSVKQVQDSVITLNDKAELTIKSTGKHIFNVQGGEGSKLTLEARTDGSFGAYQNNGLGLDYDNPESNRPVDINVGELVIKNAYEGAESPSTAIQSDGNKITLTANKMTIEGYGAGLKTDSGSTVTFNAAEFLTVSGTKSSGIRADSSAKVTLKGDTDGSTIIVSGGQYGAIRITGSSEVLFDNAAGTNKVSYTNTDVPYASINVANADSKLNMIGTNLIEGNLKVTGSAAFTGATSIAGKLIGAGNVVLNDGAMTFTDTVDGFTGTFEQKGGDVALTTDNGFFGGDVNVMGGLLKYGDIDAGTVSGPTLALGSALSLKDGAGMTVGNSKTRAGADVIFASDSKLVVDGEISGGAIVSENGGSVSVDDGAKLHIENAKVGKFQVTSGFTSAVINGSGWQEDNLTLTTSNVLAEAEKAEVEGNNIVVNITAKEVSTVLPDIIPMNNVDTMMAEGQNDISDSAPAGIRMLSRALEKTAAPDAIDAVNEVSRAAVTAGVQNTSLRIADAASNTVVSHMSLAQHDSSSAIHADGVDFWAAPMYGNLYTSGMNVAGSSVRGQFGGLALGADLKAGQFLGGKFRLGAAINGGGGQSEIKGTATSTQNDYDFGGLNFYAGWNSGALNVIASVGYGFGNHEVEMGIPVAGVNKAKADIDTSAFTADLRAEYQLKTPYVDILPHAGIRYTALKTDAHDLKVGGSVLNSVQSDTQNIVQFPVGVTLSKDFDLAGWTVKPCADVSVIPAAGDKKATTKVNFSGLDAWDSVNTRVMDSTSWAGTVGIQAEKGNMTFGLNYGVQASSNETDQNIQIKLGWKF